MKLKDLLVTQIQADFLARMERAVASAQTDELADWWCVLNARLWPEMCAVEPPSGFEAWAAIAFMHRIGGLLPKELLLSAWGLWSDEHGSTLKFNLPVVEYNHKRVVVD